MLEDLISSTLWLYYTRYDLGFILFNCVTILNSQVGNSIRIFITIIYIYFELNNLVLKMVVVY